jgi:membrane protease subunit (stomatin/prohibitin family)
MPDLGMVQGGRMVHCLIHEVHSKCGRSYLVKVEAMPPGSRMCKRCTRLDGLSLECGCDITGASLRKDGKTAFCPRCELDVQLIRESGVA